MDSKPQCEQPLGLLQWRFRGLLMVYGKAFAAILAYRELH